MLVVLYVVCYELNDDIRNVCVSLCINLCMFTVSNALLMSKATATVCCGGLGLLKPFVIWWQMLCKALRVEFMFEFMLMRNDWNFLLCMVIVFSLVFWK